MHQKFGRGYNLDQVVMREFLVLRFHSSVWIMSVDSDTGGYRSFHKSYDGPEVRGELLSGDDGGNV